VLVIGDITITITRVLVIGETTGTITRVLVVGDITTRLLVDITITITRELVVAIIRLLGFAYYLSLFGLQTNILRIVSSNTSTQGDMPIYGYHD
jgi:hypothetical protein